MRKYHWLMLLAVCTALCFATAPSRGEGALVITIKVDLDDPKTEVLIESDAGKLEKLGKVASGAVLGKNGHYISDLVLKDSKLVKIVFRKRRVADEGAKKP